jgi:hypothetical protein
MWSDTLLAAERSHLLRLAIWGALSLVIGTSLLALLAVRGARSPLLGNFAIQAVVWAPLNLAMAIWGWRMLSLRDFDSAVQLERGLWLALGIDAGVVAAGSILAAAGWRYGRREGLVGAGLGVIVQGAALLLLHWRFLAITARGIQ